MSAELSGRMDTVEDQITFITQDLLQKTDTVAYSSLSVNWNTQFELLDTTIRSIRTQLQTLQTLYTNLYITVNNHYAAFTGHTGQVLTGSNPAHSGSV